MKKKLTVLIVILISGISYAQQEAQYTQYMYNTIAVNPAYAGSRQSMSIFGLHRSQWIGLDGAPVTNTFSIHTPIRDTRIGLGLSILNDQIGPTTDNNLAVDFSYTIPLSQTYKLSFGLNASADLLNVDSSKIIAVDSGDPRFQNIIDHQFSPNFGVGLYLHSDNTYFGLSAPSLLAVKHFDGIAKAVTSNYILTQQIQYYFIAGHVFDLNEDIKFKPSMLAKMTQGAPLQVDLSGNFLINQKFTAGISYRWDAAVSALVGFQVSDSWYVGYSYDFDTTALANYNSGSHEIFLRYELFKKNNRIISPRFF